MPFAPGGTSVIVARTVAHELTRRQGQTVVVDNKGGGAGIPAMQDVASATPDGHTIILGREGSLAVNPVIFPNQPYDVNKDVIPVTMLASVPNLFVIHPDVPARDFREFVAHVKKHPGQLNYGSAGNASAGHLAPAGTPREVSSQSGDGRHPHIGKELEAAPGARPLRDQLI